ncbi:RNA helicase [Penicillium rubens]|nr:RNA helicase [Penicillium rubens]
MQPWTGGSRSLCALRPLTRFAVRPFTTTSILQRSKKAKPPISSDRKSDTKKGKTLVGGSPGRSVRQDIAAARDFNELVEATLRDVYSKLNKSGESLEGWTQFERQIKNACKSDDKKASAQWGPLRQIKVALQKAYLASGLQGLREEVEYMQYSENITARFSAPILEAQQEVADLRWPAEWYPRARSMQRTIHLHVGPTNSGKTYHALQRLAKSKNGFYAGPLRLLAQEVYHRFKADGVPCSLVTGDDVKFPDDDQVPRITSNTVEMVSLGQEYDVGVIDEIQMIANSSRGWAWTRAFLGAQVTELHLCGETRAIPLIRELCALTGDKLEVHRYERLNALEVMPHSLKDIEKTTGRRAAIVYGGLPAEIRTQQANLFNDPDNDYDFLVASDAIGMGLNLSCKRVIFDTLVKRVPTGLQRLTVPEIKQIGGRAGRYRPANAKESINDEPNVGLISCLEEVDLPYIQQAMKLEPPPLSAAGIFPPESVFRKFAAYFPPGVPFEYLIKRVLEIAKVSPLFFLCDPTSQLENAEIIDTVKGLPFEDQLKFMVSPMDRKSSGSRDVTGAMADCVAEHHEGRLLDIAYLNLEVIEQPVSGSNDYLHDLESLHRAVILYLWLSFRFGGVFTDRTLASHVKELVEERMVRALTEFSANKRLRKGASLKRQIALQKQLLEQERMGVAGDWMNPSGEGEQMEIKLPEEAVSEGAEGAEGASSDELSLYEPSSEAGGEKEGPSPDLDDSEPDSTESYYDTEVPRE